MKLKHIPLKNDLAGMLQLWSEALDILNDDNRDLKQLFARDLDDEENLGRDHIRSVMSMEVIAHSSSTFVAVASKFMLVIIHRSLLEDISIDSAVGDLYSFISGPSLYSALLDR